MLHTNRGELQLLMNTFCRIWEASGQATLTTSTEGGELKAKLEIQLGSPAAPRTGAPSTTSGHPAVSHRPCHRGPAAKARSRARAAAYQAKKAAAATFFSTAAIAAGSGEASFSSASQRRPLHLLPSPPAGRRRVMSGGRRDMPLSIWMGPILPYHRLVPQLDLLFHLLFQEMISWRLQEMQLYLLLL